MEDLSEQKIDLVFRHLNWSNTQRRILTANGEADVFYSSERGFSFSQTELPHYYLGKLATIDGASSVPPTTHDVFHQWKNEDISTLSPVVGAWKRPLFYGGWKHSTDHDEHVCNVQTTSLFVDLRIPCTRDSLLCNHRKRQSLDDLSSEELRWYARQHIFAGYSRVSKESSLPKRNESNTSSRQPFDLCCTRHHCIDWNYVGVPRSRPNKWWIETNKATNAVWKEWAYATNFQGQHYYCERWEQLDKEKSPILSLRKRSGRDGVIVVVGDHFNYCIDRTVSPVHKEVAVDCTTLVDVVDKALEMNNMEAARAWLSMQGGHGRVSQGWKLDHCIEPWRQGSALWSPTEISIEGVSIQDCIIWWNNDAWYIFECSLTSIKELHHLLQCPKANL